MFGQPSNSNAFAKIAKWDAVALIILQLLAASQMTRVELRCGAACQKITAGQDF